MRRSRPHRLLALVITPALVVGCGGGDDDASAPDTTTAAAAATDEAPTAPADGADDTGDAATTTPAAEAAAPTEAPAKPDPDETGAGDANDDGAGAGDALTFCTARDDFVFSEGPAAREEALSRMESAVPGDLTNAMADFATWIRAGDMGTPEEMATRDVGSAAAEEIGFWCAENAF